MYPTSILILSSTIFLVFSLIYIKMEVGYIFTNDNYYMRDASKKDEKD
jgi:hypothetical protein